MKGVGRVMIIAPSANTIATTKMFYTYITSAHSRIYILDIYDFPMMTTGEEKKNLNSGRRTQKGPTEYSERKLAFDRSGPLLYRHITQHNKV